MNRTLWAILISSFLLSCKKEKVQHPIAGNYDCVITSSSWDLSGYYSTLTTYDTIEVVLENDSIKVFNLAWHEDSLVEGQDYFYGYSYNNITVRFENDSLFSSHFSGGLGGGTTTTTKGRKID